MARRPKAKESQATPSRLRDIAAIIGALAALAWPVVVLLTRVRRIRLTVGHGGFEIESVLRDADAADGGSSCAWTRYLSAESHCSTSGSPHDDLGMDTGGEQQRRGAVP
jgi:hypothetical protein